MKKIASALKASLLEALGSAVFLWTAMLILALGRAVGQGIPISGPLAALLTGLAIAVGVAVGIRLAASQGDGHLNAAVTIAMSGLKETSPLALIPHIAAQVAGFWFATKTVIWLGFQSAVIVPKPAAGAGMIDVITYEFIGIMLLVFAVAIAVGADGSPAQTAVFVGGALLIAVVMAAPISGGAINPSLSLGTQLATGQTGGLFGYWWWYWAAGIAAAIGFTALARRSGR